MAPTPHPVSPTAPPLTGRQIMHQRWEHLTFLHWRVDPELVAPLLPSGTTPDVYDGSSWVGLIPFRLADAGVGRGPSVSWLGTFAETNVRLYSVDETGRRGVVFRSLESARLGVVLAARAGFGLPYTWARMRIDQTAGQISYRTRRRWPSPRGAGGQVVVRPGDLRVGPDPLGEFLTARWGLHSAYLGRTLYVPNTHETWPLHDATLLELQDSLVAAAGFPGLTSRPPDSVLYSPGVTTQFGFPFAAAKV